MSADRKTEEVVTEPTPSKNKYQHASSLFWGILIVATGVFLLLGSMGLIDLNWSNIWQLWPLAIIGVGVSILPLKGWGGALTSTLLALAIIAAFAFVSLDHSNSADQQTKTAQITQLSETVYESVMTAEIGASELILSSSDDKLVSATLTGDSDKFNIKQTSAQTGNTQYSTISTEHNGWAWLGLPKNSLNLALGTRLPTTFNINAGASNIHGDLSNVQLKKLSIDVGASSVDLKIGNKVDSQEAIIHGGVSSFVLRIPASTSVHVISDSGLSSFNLEGVDKLNDDEYKSSDFDTSKSKLTIRADIGVSSLKIIRY